MSAFGDTVSYKSTIVDDDEKEEYSDDVSIHSRSEQTNWGVIIFKVCLSLVFIGFATGCIIYSVLTSDEYIHPNAANESTVFIYDISQHCPEGTLTWTNRTGTINDYDTISFGISWLQDSTRRRIFHRIGIEEHDEDWQASYFVFSNHSFVVNKTGCDRQPIGYHEFLRRFGLENIRKLRTESFKVDNENIKVNYYEGEPSRDIIIEGMHPAIVRAYSATNNTFDYGWEYIFAHGTDDETGLFRKEYWFPEMSAGDSDYSVFESVPDSCFEKKTSEGTT